MGSVAQALLPVRVLSVRWHAAGVLEFELGVLGGAAIPPFEPGAHVDLHLPNGLVRSYSLLGEWIDGGSCRVAVAREDQGRGGSRYMHEELRAGAEIAISAPRNLFPLEPGAAHVTFIAGGIGITPLLGMMQRCARLGIPWALHYSVQHGPAPFAAELARLPGGTIHHYHTRAPEGRRMPLAEILGALPEGGHAYGCGPNTMLDAFAAAGVGLPPECLHVERFHPAEITDGAGFTVSLKASGRDIEVAPDASILQTLLDAGVDASYACTQGYCGLCEVRVLDGAVEHRDDVKTPDEHDRDRTMMICCSRARGERIVIDL